MPLMFLIVLAVLAIGIISSAISHRNELRLMTPRQRRAFEDEERADMQTW
jgi:hypothetical protein